MYDEKYEDEDRNDFDHGNDNDYDDDYLRKKAQQEHVKEEFDDDFLRENEQNQGDKPEKHECQECGKVFRLAGGLKIHSIKHGKKLKCEVCSKEFSCMYPKPSNHCINYLCIPFFSGKTTEYSSEKS